MPPGAFAEADQLFVSALGWLGETYAQRNRTYAAQVSLPLKQGSLVRVTSTSSGRVTYVEAAQILGVHVSCVVKLVQKRYLLSERRRDGSLLETDVIRLKWLRAQESASPPLRPRRARPKGAAPDDGYEWIDAAGAGRRLGITSQAIAQRLRKGTMPGVRRGVRWWIRADHLELDARAKQARERRAA